MEGRIWYNSFVTYAIILRVTECFWRNTDVIEDAAFGRRFHPIKSCHLTPPSTRRGRMRLWSPGRLGSPPLHAWTACVVMVVKIDQRNVPCRPSLLIYASTSNEVTIDHRIHKIFSIRSPGYNIFILIFALTSDVTVIWQTDWAGQQGSTSGTKAAL